MGDIGREMEGGGMEGEVGDIGREMEGGGMEGRWEIEGGQEKEMEGGEC